MAKCEGQGREEQKERKTRDCVHRTYSNRKNRTNKPVARASLALWSSSVFFFLSFSLSVHFPFTILRFYDSFLSFQVCEQVSFQQSRAIRVTIPLGFAFVHPFVARIPIYIYIYIAVYFSRLAIEKFARFHVKTWLFNVVQKCGKRSMVTEAIKELILCSWYRLPSKVFKVESIGLNSRGSIDRYAAKGSIFALINGIQVIRLASRRPL